MHDVLFVTTKSIYKFCNIEKGTMQYVKLKTYRKEIPLITVAGTVLKGQDDLNSIMILLEVLTQ